jgi:hypothetical protein
MHRLEKAIDSIKASRDKIGRIASEISLDNEAVYYKYYIRLIKAYAGDMAIAIQYIKDELDAQCPTEDEYHEHLHDAR